MQKPPIKRLLESLQNISETELYEELLQEKNDEELHALNENELFTLIFKVLKRIKMKKMRKEVKLIYI